MRKKLALAGAIIATISTGGIVIAQHKGHGGGHAMHGDPKHGSGAHDAHPKGDMGPSSMAFQAANSKMHAAMDITFTGDADRDFAAGMIAHHEGAIEMAEVVLKFGKDPAMKKLAQDIISAQKKEIAWMKEWMVKTSK